MSLSAELRTVGEARRFLRGMLQQWNVDAYDFGAPQILTELATNAALHAHTEYTVVLTLEPEWLLVEVTDSSPALPQQRHYRPDSTTGRGLGLVEALSGSWGVEPSKSGKTVWARVAPDESLNGFTDNDFSVLSEEGRPQQRPAQSYQSYSGDVRACAA
jgi:anti-sigma regulatory factor (Ser/Thr protein kinase)